MSEDYQDSDGNQRSLTWMVANEREWAESRLRHMRAQVEQQAEQIERLRAAWVEACNQREGMAQYAERADEQIERLRDALEDLCATLGECGMTAKARAALADQKEGKV
jgi:chromosome segregation ATPase